MFPAITLVAITMVDHEDAEDVFKVKYANCLIAAIIIINYALICEKDFNSD